LKDDLVRIQVSPMWLGGDISVEPQQRNLHSLQKKLYFTGVI